MSDLLVARPDIEAIAELPEISSPCIGVCTVNDEDICRGCGRSLAEIGRWSRLDNQAKKQILEKVAQRKLTD